jgi:hypothetical protein
MKFHIPAAEAQWLAQLEAGVGSLISMWPELGDQLGGDVARVTWD